jgi:serine/threonine-protein kinase
MTPDLRAQLQSYRCVDAARARGESTDPPDSKPENILLANGRLMVADFGIALAVSAAAGGRMTETGLSLGTSHDMLPEQATAEKEMSARSDVYSLRACCVQCWPGSLPTAAGPQIGHRGLSSGPASLTA